MYTLGLDTAHRFLVVSLMDDSGLIDGVQTECVKQQSEQLLPQIDSLLKKHNLTPNDIGALVVTKGPGSYTGVRIAMTFAKVTGAMRKLPVYTLSTLQLYAGLADCYSIIDARSQRVYAGRYQNGQALMADTIYTNEQMAAKLQNSPAGLAGDGHLFGRPDNYGSLALSFWQLKPQWRRVENTDLLEPDYLKARQEYLVKNV